MLSALPQSFDGNGDGTLSFDEFSKGLQTVGACLGEGDAQAVYAEMAKGDRLSYVKEKRGGERRGMLAGKEKERDEEQLLRSEC